jgi:hypothetical protein
MLRQAQHDTANTTRFDARFARAIIQIIRI